MNRPPLRTRILGHAMVVVPMGAITLWSVFTVMQDINVWPLVVLMFLLMRIIMGANERMLVYRGWKRGWDSLAPQGAPRRRRAWSGWRVLLLAAMTVGVLAYCVAHRDQPAYRFALGWMSVGVVLVLLVMLVRWRRTRMHPLEAKAVVTCCLRSPLMPVPPLTAAYAVLPQHCRQVLHVQGQDHYR